MEMYILLILAIAPPLIIAVYIYDLNKNSQTDLRTCLQLMAYGALAVFPIVIVETITLPLFAGDGLFIQMLLGVALVEEGFKFFVIKRFVYGKDKFSAPIDGIIYAVMVGLGFALIENLSYVINFGFFIGITRMLTAVPMHAICGVLLGYFIGRAKLEPAKEKKLIAAGLLSAVLLHGIYNFMAFLSIGILPLFIVLGIGFYYANSMVRKGQTISSLLKKLSITYENPDDVEKTAAPNPKSSSQTISKTATDEFDIAAEFYEQAYKELELGEANSGIWAKAYAKSSGEEEAKKEYINRRAEKLYQEDLARLEQVAKKERLLKENQEEKNKKIVERLQNLKSWALKNDFVIEEGKILRGVSGSWKIRKLPFGGFDEFDDDLSFAKHLITLYEKNNK
jgi:protease PrsW